MSRRHCVQVTKSGTPCRNKALLGHTLCGVHSRGLSKHNPIVLDDSPPASPKPSSPKHNPIVIDDSPPASPRPKPSSPKSRNSKREASPDSPRRDSSQNKQLWDACKAGDLKMVTNLLKSSHVDVNRLVGDKTILTRVLCSEIDQSEKERIVKLLLKHGANPNIGLCFGVSPLIFSIDRYGRSWITPIRTTPNTVKLLLEHGANPNVMSMNTTALLCTVSHPHEASIQALTKALLNAGADPDIPGRFITLSSKNKYVQSDTVGEHIIPLAAITIGENYRSEPLKVAQLLVEKKANMKILSASRRNAFHIMSMLNRQYILSNEGEFKALLSFYIDHGCPFDKEAFLRSGLNIGANFEAIISTQVEKMLITDRKAILAVALHQKGSGLNRSTEERTKKIFTEQWAYTREPMGHVFDLVGNPRDKTVKKKNKKEKEDPSVPSNVL